MKSFLIIGAGKFGRHLAFSLCDMDYDVMLVDKNEEIINAYADRVTSAECGDFTLRKNLESLGVTDYDYVIVANSNFQDSLEIVDQLKSLGAKKVIAKASSEIHEKFLLKNGADKVFYPERDAALRTAIEISNTNIDEYYNLGSGFAISDIAVPKEWQNKTLVNLELRKKHQVNVLAIKKDQTINNIAPDYTFKKGDHVIVFGSQNEINKITKE